MRKRVIICSVLALAAVLIISICLIVHHNSVTPKHGDLVVNGEIVCQNNIDIYKNNVAHIPLVKVMQAMGFDVQWENDNVANINGYGKTLVLNVSQMSLTETDSSINLITPAPGSRNFYCQAASKDIILDDNTVKSIMTLLGIDIRIDVDTSQTAVYIYTTADLSSSALPANIHTEYDGFYITLNSVSEKFVSVTWHNDTDDENITFGEYYHIEIYKNGAWERVPATGEIIVHDIAYIIPGNGGQKKMSYSLSNYDMSAEGTYRVRCEFYDNGNKFNTWVEFEMNN